MRASFIALVFVSILGCAALGLREVECRALVGSDGGAADGGSR